MKSNVLPPPPRSARLRPEAWDRVFLLRIFCLPFVAAGIFFVFKILETPVTRLLGHDAMARIVQVQPYFRGADGRRFDVAFSYDVWPGVRVEGYGIIDTAGGPPPVVGQNVPIRLLVVGSWYCAELRDEPRGISAYVCMGLFATVWCGIVLLLTMFAWLGPIFRKQLIREGKAATGVITSKEKRSGRRNTYYGIHYRYQISTGEKQVGKERVSLPLFEQLVEGQTVTVIYDMQKPARSAVYEASDYEVVA
jgi:uncharacterized protein DUF3592